MDIFKEMSVIIPFYGKDLLWKDLLRDLKHLPEGADIILVGPDEPDSEILAKATADHIADIRYVPAVKGRGRQLNAGVKASEKNFFWFLHADSKVPRPALTILADALLKYPDSLHHFNLQFLMDGPRLTQLNSVAANWRARYLGMPFGDQGFAIRRAEFYKVGGFPEHEPYGEDHAFVWEARRKHISLHSLDASIFTSARRYEEEGWGKLTSKRVYRTTVQAAREAYKLCKVRVIEAVRKG